MNDSWIEAEQAIVSYAFIEPLTFAKVAASVDPDDFFDKPLGRLCGILRSMQSMIDLRDINAVLIELNRIGQIQAVGGPAIIAKLATKGFLPHNADYYADRLRHFGKINRCRRAAQQLLKDCDDQHADSVDVNQSLADFNRSTTKAFRPKDASIQFSDLGRKLLARMEHPEQQTGTKILTGFDCVDGAAGGFFRGQLVLLSGRSYRGKTMLAMNFATKLAKQNYRALMLNLEMTAEELAERGYSDVGDIDYSRFVHNDFSTTSKMQIKRAIEESNDWPLWVHDNTGESIESIVAKIEYEHLTKKLDVVFVDHLQRIENRSRREQRFHLKECCQAMKNLARRLGVVVVLLTQLKTPANAEDQNDPTEADYSEAKQIVEEADLAMMLHRRSDEQGGKLIFNKVRKGQPTFAYLELDGAKQRFYEVPQVEKWTP